jgi:hypothetical protein
MVRDLFINGPTLVTVKGNIGTTISTISELGLSDNPIRVSLNERHMDVNVDAYGGEIPMELQYKLVDVNINMTLMHIDPDVLDACLKETRGGAAAVGTLTTAGSRLGNNAARFAAAWHFVELGLTSPIGLKPWRFYNCYLTGQPLEIPLGVERSIFVVNFRCIPYTNDPYSAGGTTGLGTAGYVLWDNVIPS